MQNMMGLACNSLITYKLLPFWKLQEAIRANAIHFCFACFCMFGMFCILYNTAGSTKNSFGLGVLNTSNTSCVLISNVNDIETKLRSEQFLLV